MGQALMRSIRENQNRKSQISALTSFVSNQYVGADHSSQGKVIQQEVKHNLHNTDKINKLLKESLLSTDANKGEADQSNTAMLIGSKNTEMKHMSFGSEMGN